ncbi:MAG: FAD:protein FMN transferase [Ignavibacteriaceae bacterium]|nr:FAD:protein FMN transferase [Ignavibacteriaceae bacterium]
MLFRGKILFLLLLLFGSELRSQENPVFEVNAVKYLLGTEIEIKALTPSIEAGKYSLYIAFREIERIDSLLSWSIPTSEISKINLNSGKVAVKVSEEVFDLLSRAIAYCKEFDGYFDITIGPLTQLWGFSSDEIVMEPPSETSIQELLPIVNYKLLVLDSTNRTAFLQKKGMAIDLGGIGKGYAIDRAAAKLRSEGTENFIINAGGDIFTSGNKVNGENWRVGVKHPREEDELFAIIETTNEAVVTSGDYERYFIFEGVRYHHLLNPRTGYPVSKNMSVTVISKTAEEADVYSTALFISASLNENEKLIKFDCLIIDSEGKYLATPKYLINR